MGSREPGTAPSPFRARATRVFACLAVALSFALAVTRVSSYDAWVHLSLGRWMAESGHIPRTNLLSYTQPDRPVTDHQWLFQLALYEVWTLAGPSGAILAKAAVVAAALGAAFAAARRKRAAPLLALWLVVLAAGASRFRFTLRPQVVGLLLLSLYLWLLERWRAGRCRGLLAVLPLQVLWANVHGSAIVGCGLLLGVVVGEGLRAAMCRRRADASAVSPQPPGRRQFAWLVAVALAVVPLTLLNPNGARLLALPFAHAARQASWGLKGLLQDRAPVTWGDLGGRHACFAILAAAALASLVGSLARRDATEAGLCLGTLAAALYSERFIGVFAIAAAPIAARNLTDMVRAPLRAIGPRLSLAAGMAGALALAALGIIASEGHTPAGLGLAPGRFPDAEVAFVQQRYPTGNLFNEFEHGGYIYWRTRRPVFIDSRGMLAYGPAFFRRYVDAWESPETWSKLVTDYRVRVALVARRALQRMFRASDRWEQVFQGPVCAVFVRRAPAR